MQRDPSQSEELEGIIQEYAKHKKTLSMHSRSQSVDGPEYEPKLAEDIETYAKELIKSQEWTTEYETEDIVLKSRLEGKLAPEVRVAYMQIKFSPKVTLDAVYKALDVPQARMQWDTTVLEMKETPPVSRNTRIVYTAINHAIFGRPKDFVEKKILTRSEKDICVVFHSTESMVGCR